MVGASTDHDTYFFRQLLRRHRPFVTVLVDVTATRSVTRFAEAVAANGPVWGVWKLDLEGFKRVANHIIDSERAMGKEPTLKSIAERADLESLGQRWWRLDAEWGRWLDENQPITQIRVDSLCF